MKATVTAILAAALLSACATKPAEKPEVTIAPRVEYVVKVPPAELLELPKAPAPIDVDRATQADVARWVAANEKWINETRNRFIEIAKFLRDEQQKLDAVAKEANDKVGTAGDPSKVIKLEEPKKK